MPRGTEACAQCNMLPGERLSQALDLPGEGLGKVGRLDHERQPDLALEERTRSFRAEVEGVAVGADDWQDRSQEEVLAVPVFHGRKEEVAAGEQFIKHSKNVGAFAR